MDSTLQPMFGRTRLDLSASWLRTYLSMLCVLTSFCTVLDARAEVVSDSALRKLSPSGIPLLGHAQGISCGATSNVMYSHRAEIHACWEKYLLSGGDVARTAELSVRGELAADGRVTKAEVFQRTVRNADLEACLAGAVGTWQFAAPRSGRGEVVLPFDLVATRVPSHNVTCTHQEPSATTAKQVEDHSQIATVDAAVLSSERLDTLSPPPIPSELHRQLSCGTYRPRYRVCVGSSGEVLSVTPEISFPGGDESFIAALSAWRFRERQEPVCASFSLLLSLSDRESRCAELSREFTQLPSLLFTKIAKTTPPIPVPSSLRSLPACSRAHGFYRMCVSAAGDVQSVQPMEHISADDDAVIETLKQWKYAPLAAPACFVRHVSLRGEGTCSNDKQSESEPQCSIQESVRLSTQIVLAMTRPVCATSPPPMTTMRFEAVPNETPHLTEQARSELRSRGVIRATGVYRLCFDESGLVYSVAVQKSLFPADLAIMKTLTKWRFPPRPFTLCLKETLEFVLM